MSEHESSTPGEDPEVEGHAKKFHRGEGAEPPSDAGEISESTSDDEETDIEAHAKKFH